jgi:hypothetical protein
MPKEPKEEEVKETPKQETKNPTYDEWLATQDEPTRNIVTGRMSKLDATNKAVRAERDAFQQQLDGVKKTLGSDPERAKQEMDRLTGEYAEAQKRIAFLEEATDPKIECLNPPAAWAIAIANKLFRSTGSPDWQEIKKMAPQLFGKAAEDIGAGAGTEGNGVPKTKADMNSWIRRQAGIQT